MTEYAPTRQEFDEVSRKLWDIFEHCVLVYELMQVQHLRDLCQLPDSPTEIEQKEDAALRDVTYLNGLLHHLPKLAATDFQALGEVWPQVLGALEYYTEDYTELTDVRRLAQLLGAKLWAELPKQRGGRDTRSSPIARDQKELWSRGKQVLDYFRGVDPGQAFFVREYMRGAKSRRGLPQRRVDFESPAGWEGKNPGRSLLRRAESLGITGGYQGLLQFLQGPPPN